MPRIKRYAPFQNLSNYQVFIEDSLVDSQYFKISELSETFTGGKNGFLIEGTPFLRETTEVKIEVLDVNGNPVYVQPGDGLPEYYEGLSKLVSIHVYNDTPIGIGTITILGELKEYKLPDGRVIPVPEEWKGAYNVRWQKSIFINRNLNNEDIVRFFFRPRVSILEFTKPVFSKTIPNITQSGSVIGTPETPPAGIDLRTWGAGTLYKLTKVSGPSWSSSIDENTISIPSLGFEPTIIEVLNDNEVLVDLAYTGSDNRVTSFTTASYTASFDYIDGAVVSDTSTESSFAKIDITRLETFVGDVARVKIFRKSRNTAGDYTLVQESKLESTELLKDVTTQTDVETLYGFFNQQNLDAYWVSGSDTHPVTINNDVLADSLKIDYAGSGTQTLTTVNSFSFTEGVEYTLALRTLLSGSVTTSSTLRAYLSASTFTQDIITLSGSNQYITREQITENIISENTGDAKLVFEFIGADWYLSNVSLKVASETAFSPDEFSIVQNIPRKTSSEIFDFRFEFYDINNNYIPVDVFASKEFDGGNDFGAGAGGGGKLLTFESSQNAFRFISGSFGNPPFQQILLTTTTSGISGSITYASAAYDIGGNYIDPGSYTGDYPGGLTGLGASGGTLTIANFSGSDPSYTVGSIIYSASADDVEEYETIFRLEDGENAPTLIATSNANQFIYEPTKLSPKPAGQAINIRTQRKNLASLVTPITVNSASDAGTPPPLTFVGTDSSRGIDTYSINATDYSASNAGSTFPETTYSFTGSDAFGNLYSDEITISPVINFDGVSIVLSNETTAFRANSVGVVTPAEYDLGDGIVNVRIGNTQIEHSDGLLARNTFDIVGVTGSTGVTVNEASPTTNAYGISSMSLDSGSAELNITYLAGDNSTTVDFTKLVTYTKARTATPVVNVYANPIVQGVNASYDFATVGTPLDITFSVVQAGTSYSYDAAVNNEFEFAITSVTNGTNNGNGTVTPNTPSTATGVSGSVTLSYRDSEGTLTTGYTQDFFVTVALEGVTGSAGPSGSDGATGPQGDPGLLQKSGQVYYQLTGVPGTPSATSYTFSTDTFVGLSSNWAKTPPTYIGSNSNTYYYSYYVAVENSAGSNTASGGNLVFGAPLQGMGFTGLVTFTGTNSVSDGSDTLSFGAGGTTAIDGGSIITNTVTATQIAANTITAGQIAANTITANQISSLLFTGKTAIFDVGKVGGWTIDGNSIYSGTKDTSGYSTTGITFYSSGSIHAPNFYVDTSGNMNTRGGTVGGWTISANGIYHGTYDASGYTGNVGDITLSSAGSIHTNDFYIDTSGNAFFRGALSAATGTFAGSLSAASGTFTGTLSGGTITGGTANFGSGQFIVSSSGDLEMNSSGSFNFNGGSDITLGPGSVLIGGVRTDSLSTDGGYFDTTGTIYSPSGFYPGGYWFFRSDGETTSVRNIAGFQAYTFYNGPVHTRANESDILHIAAQDIVYIGSNSGSSWSSPFAFFMSTGNFAADGNVTAYASDERLKVNLGPIEEPLEKVKQLRGINFVWNSNKLEGTKLEEHIQKETPEVGVFAQDVQKVLPSVVKPAPFDMDASGKSISGENYLTVQYEKLTPLLIEAVKELTAKVEKLEKEISILKKRE